MKPPKLKSGGSVSLEPRRIPKPQARKRSKSHLSLELLNLWEPEGSGQASGFVYEIQDGLIASLLVQSLTENKIRSFIPCGGYKVSWVRDELRDLSLWEKRLTLKLSWHALTDNDLHNLIDNVNTWDLD